jgi:AraC family cel operon transcriptional repressor
MAYIDFMRKLRFLDFCLPGAQGHFGVSRIAQRGPVDPHTHDFIEFFWITAGEGTHWINGQSRALQPGDMMFIVESDQHAFGADPGLTLTLVNVAFPRRTWRRLINRHQGQVPDYFMATEVRKRERRLTGLQLNQLAEAAVDLGRGRLGSAALERFLLNTAWIISGDQEVKPRHPGQAGELPAWLHQACQEIRDPRHFARGVWGFYDLCDRSPEHVIRTCRRLLGKTVAELVNDARLVYVAQELSWSDRRVLDIAMDCGLDLSHLHRLFRRCYGLSPGTFRRRQKQIVMAMPVHGRRRGE